MNRYRLIIRPRTLNMLEARFEFLARLNLRGAQKMRNQFWETLQEIKENPFQFPVDMAVPILDCNYRKALFGKHYKVLYLIEEKTIFIDAVVDCRMDPASYFFDDTE